MNRLILKLGLVTLTVLPVVAVASCSSTTPETPSLNTEVNKYKNPFTVKDSSKTMKPEEVAKSINDATVAQKLTTLQTFVTLQLDTNNFTYEVGEAKAGANNTVDVSFKIAEKADSTKNQTITLVINGFTPSQSAIEAEAAKLVNNTVISSKAGETAAEAATKINATTLVDYYAKVNLSEGFSYAWKSNEVVGDTVKVTVTVSSTDTSISPIDHSFIISGFKTALEAEAEKFAISLQTKNTEITTRQVTFGINEQSTTQAAKLTAINAIVTGFPPTPTGFSLTIGEATIATDPNTSVTVALTITQTSTGTTKEVIFTITSLAAETLQQEVNRLATANLVNKEVLTAKKGETAAQAGTAITTIETLGQYYDLVPLPKGLTYVYTSNTVENDTVKVTAEVSSSESGITAASKQFTITGFKTTAMVALEEAAEKMIPQVTKLPEQTAFQAQAAITTQGDQGFNLYYTTISLGTGYGYTYGGKSEVNKDTPTTLDVTMRVKTNDNSLSMLKVVQITGFKEPTPIEKEALKFQTSLAAKNPEILSTGVISVINAIGDNQENKLTALKAYVDNFPTIGDTYTLTIGRATIDASTPTSVNIIITISPKAEVPANRNTSVVTTFTITDLTVGTQEEQLDAISKLFNNRTVLESKKSETAAAAQALINSDARLNGYYQQTILPTGFSYNYGGKSEVNKQTTTTLDVTLRISIRNTNHVIFKVVQISGFTALTEQEKEAQKFAISAPAKTQGMLTSAVITTINTESTQENKLSHLQGFVANFPDTTGFTLNIGQAKLDPSKDTSVMIPITVTKNPVAEGVTATPVSVFFIITGLTVPPTEA